MTIKKNRKLYIAIAVALFIRLALCYFQYSGDVKNHLAWGNGFLSQPIGFYSHHFPGFNDPNYPPLTILLFAASNFLYGLFAVIIGFLNRALPIFPSFIVPVFESENMKMAFLKLPAMISDVLIGYYLYSFTVQQKRTKPLLIACLYLFNPAVIYISAVWGQIESLTIIFLLLSLVFAERLSLLSLIFFTLSALTKQTALWFAPFYLLLWHKKIHYQEFLRGLLYSVIVFFTSFLPFGLDPWSAIKVYMSTLSGSSTVVSDAAWNIWYYLFPSGTNDSAMIGFLSVRQISIAILVICLGLLIYKLVTRYSDNRFFYYLFIWSLLVFFVQTRVHERHLAPALLFCLLTPGLLNRYFVDYFVLSAYHMYNLYSILKLPFI